LLIVALVLVGGAALLFRSGGNTRATVEKPSAVYLLEARELVVSLQGKGTLEAVRNLDIESPIPGQQTIKSIIAEGTVVKKDDVIIELDTSEIEREIQRLTIEVERFTSDLTNSQQQLKLHEIESTAKLESAEVETRLADLSLREYVEGTYPQKLNEAEREVEMAKVDLDRKSQDLTQARTLLARGFVTTTEIASLRHEQLKAQNALERARANRDVLRDYTHEKQRAELVDKVSQARSKLERTRLEIASQRAQREADIGRNTQSLEVNRQALSRQRELLTNCTIKSPGDGIVIYNTSLEQWRRDSPLQAGSRIWEGERLIRIPDTTSMKVTYPVPEQHVVKLVDFADRKFQAKVLIPGHPEPIAGVVERVSALPDGSSWWNPDSKTYSVDIALSTTPARLKPGVSVEVELVIDRIADTVAVPYAAVFSEGERNWVFVEENQAGFEPVEVKLGRSSETHIEITGVDSGKSVWLLEPAQGKRLLASRGIKPADRPAEEPNVATIPPLQSP
jgi:HlyD family secretion protein